MKRIIYFYKIVAENYLQVNTSLEILMELRRS
jgi:hypothetical protein